MEKLTDIFKNEENLKNIIPSYSFREEQFEMANGIYDVISNGETLLIESPCGTGKTLAYIIPSFVYCEESKQKVVITTSTITLQNQLISDFIEPISKLFPDIHYIKLLGKSNYLCLKRAAEYIDSGFTTSKEEETIELIRENRGEFESKTIEYISEEIFTLNCNYEFCNNFKCPYFTECFYFNGRKNANSSHIIVVNHALYMSEKKLEDGAEDGSGFILPSHDVLIIDEAHKIPDSITSTFTESFNISKIYNQLFSLDQIEIELSRKNISCMKQLKEISIYKENLLESGDDFFQFLKNRYKKRSGSFVISELERNRVAATDEYIKFLRNIKIFNGYVKSNLIKLSSSYFKIVNIFEFFIVFFDFFENYDDEKFFWIDNGKNLTIKQSPYSVDNIFNDFFIENLNSLVMTSGTLGFKGDFGFFKERLNLVNSIDLSYYKNFDKDLSRICYIPESIPTPKEEGFFSSLVIEIDNISRLISGRILILFTSLSLMNSTYEELKIPLELNNKKVLVQGEMSKTKLMEKFKNNENSILFASQSFWEGIDLKGNPLRGLIMTRLPFSVPDDPIIKARSEKIKNDGGNPFMDMFIPMAVMKLKQGIGRLIRDKNEWGVLSILDSRILNSKYGKLFLKELNELEVVTDLSEVENFINRKKI
jgi:ATP-dependent DNA helicase DinG